MLVDEYIIGQPGCFPSELFALNMRSAGEINQI